VKVTTVLLLERNVPFGGSVVLIACGVVIVSRFDISAISIVLLLIYFYPKMTELEEYTMI
jgi:hypothetical protein